MRPPQGASEWRVEIFLSVRQEVMAAMVGRPPERSFLIGRRSGKSDQELKNSASYVGAVSEESMKSGGDGEHTRYVKRQTGADCYRAHARPDDEQASQVHKKELHADEVIEFFPFERAKIRTDRCRHQKTLVSIRCLPL